MAAGADATAGVIACVAVPLIKAGQSIGVLMFFVGKSWAADEEIIALLARIAENVSFALDNFERADEKAKADEQKERLTRMFAALSATNEAIMRAKSRTEMFELVCEAAAQGGRFNSTSILLARPDSDYLDMVAVGRADRGQRPPAEGFDQRERSGRTRASAARRSVRGRPASATISSTTRAARRSSRSSSSEGARSGAAFPLLVDGQPVGVMLFISSETDTFTPEFAELLQRLADNVSFALGNFDRADEKAKTEEQKERLTRMFAALSATNEAIMRAKSRSELFELVCEAAAQRRQVHLDHHRAGADPTATIWTSSLPPDRPRPARARRRMSVNEAHRKGAASAAWRSARGKPCIINDYLADRAAQAFHASARSDGAQSGAAFPLLVRGQVVGVMIFIAAEKHTFTPEFAELLQRLTDNVSFALENFDRADEKTKADERIEYLASHDSLTNLPNREMFNGLLRRTIDAAERYQRQFARAVHRSRPLQGHQRFAGP